MTTAYEIFPAAWFADHDRLHHVGREDPSRPSAPVEAEALGTTRPLRSQPGVRGSS